MRTRLTRQSGLALGIAVLLAAPFAGAEEPLRVAQAPAEEPEAPRQPPPDSDIEEIVVIGSESESSADFAAGDSVTGFGAEDLAALGAQSVADLASFTPNLEIVTSGATTPTFFIRGVGLNDFNANSTGAVAIYQDDVALNAPALQLGALFDVEAVNIQRGPQGTGLARNASAGAIKIYSRKPSGDFGGFLRTDFGNYDYQKYEGAFEAPIYEDILAGRFAFQLTKRDGTMDNRCGGAPPRTEEFRTPYPDVSPQPPNNFGPWSICGEPVGNTPDGSRLSNIPPGLEEEVNDLDNWATRGTLRFQPTLDQTWLVNAHGSRRDELSRLGQSYGTGGSFCLYGETCRPSQAIPIIEGLLGGNQDGPGGGTLSTEYWTPEVRQRYLEMGQDCVLVAGRASCANSAVRRGVARELAQDLDEYPWEGDFNHTGPTTSDNWGGYLKGDIALGGGINLSTTTGYDTYDRLIDIDLDFSPQTLFHITTEDEAWQVYQDVSLEGDLGEDSAVRWEIGGWMLREELEAFVQNDFGSTGASVAGVRDRDYTQEIWNGAGYGWFAWDFWDDFTLDGGVRYNWTNKKFDMLVTNFQDQENTYTFDETWQAPSGTLRLTYRFREDTQAFWKYTRGWKPGTINATASQFRGPTVAEPEEIDSFEAGVRGSWLTGRLGMDASIFYYAYADYQIFTAQQFLGGNPEFVILNANDAEVYGAEIDATGRPWAGAFLNVRFSWLESQFLDFRQVDQFLENLGQQAGTQVVFRERQNSGNQLLNSPRFKVSLTAEQSIPLGRYGSAALRYDGVWTDTTYYDASEGKGLGNDQGQQFLPDDTIGQVPYWLHNLRLSWRDPTGKMELALWVRNLTNEAYKTFAFDGSTFAKTTIYFVGDPRTYGVSAVFNF